MSRSISEKYLAELEKLEIDHIQRLHNIDRIEFWGKILIVSLALIVILAPFIAIMLERLYKKLPNFF